MLQILPICCGITGRSAAIRAAQQATQASMPPLPGAPGLYCCPDDPAHPDSPKESCTRLAVCKAARALFDRLASPRSAQRPCGRQNPLPNSYNRMDMTHFRGKMGHNRCSCRRWCPIHTRWTPRSRHRACTRTDAYTPSASDCTRSRGCNQGTIRRRAWCIKTCPYQGRIVSRRNTSSFRCTRNRRRAPERLGLPGRSHRTGRRPFRHRFLLLRHRNLLQVAPSQTHRCTWHQIATLPDQSDP